MTGGSRMAVAALSLTPAYIPPRGRGLRTNPPPRPTSQQPPLATAPPAVPRQIAVGGDDAVAWDDDRDEVLPVRPTDRPYGFHGRDRPGLLAVAAGLAEGDGQEVVPRFPIE